MRTEEELIIFFNEQVPELLGKLTEETKPIWGTMDAQRVVEHLILGVKIGNGNIQIPVSKIDAKASKFKIISLLSDRPLPRDFQNPILQKGLQPYVYSSLDEAKKMLLDELKVFHLYFKNGDNITSVHNLFGELNYHEWLWFEYKHFMHHFMQFGLVPISERIH